MSKDQPKLKPCPFCGGEAEMCRVFGRIGVACKQCNVNFRSEFICCETGYDGIIAAWNTRPDQPKCKTCGRPERFCICPIAEARENAKMPDCPPKPEGEIKKKMVAQFAHLEKHEDTDIDYVLSALYEVAGIADRRERQLREGHHCASFEMCLEAGENYEAHIDRLEQENSSLNAEKGIAGMGFVPEGTGEKFRELEAKLDRLGLENKEYYKAVNERELQNDEKQGQIKDLRAKLTTANEEIERLKSDLCNIELYAKDCLTTDKKCMGIAQQLAEQALQENKDGS